MWSSASRPKPTTKAPQRSRRARDPAGAVSPPKLLSLWWAVPCGLAMGVLVLTFQPGASSAGLDPTTIVPPARFEEMFRGYGRVDFSLLSSFVFGDEESRGSAGARAVANEPIPREVQALNGRRIAVGGFMLPVDYDGAGVTEFLLNASYDMCYFGAPTLPNQFIVVKMRDGRRTQFVHTPVVAFGTLTIKEERRGGRVVSLYHMEAEAIGLNAMPR